MWSCSHEETIPIWPCQKTWKIQFPSSLILREMRNEKTWSLENGDWGSEKWDPNPFLEKHQVLKFPEVPFSTSQMWFSSFLKNISSTFLVHPLSLFFLPSHWDTFIKPKNRNQLGQEDQKEITGSSLENSVDRARGEMSQMKSFGGVCVGGCHSLWS